MVDIRLERVLVTVAAICITQTTPSVRSGVRMSNPDGQSSLDEM